MKYKINYYAIILDFTTNSIVFAVISDLKSRSLLYVNGGGPPARGVGHSAERKKKILVFYDL